MEEMKKELRRVEERLGGRMDRLEGGQARLEDGQVRLEQQVTRTAILLEEFADRTSISLSQLADQGRRTIERLDTFGELMIRGFTDAAARDQNLERRVDVLEQRVTDLERR